MMIAIEIKFGIEMWYAKYRVLPLLDRNDASQPNQCQQRTEKLSTAKLLFEQ